MDARQDANGRSTLLWVSSVDGKTPIPIRVNPITGRVLIEMIWTAVWIQPSGTPFSVWQIPVYLSTDGYTVGALSGSGYIKLVSGVPSVLSAIVASDITQSASYRFVTDTEKSTWNGKQNALGFTPENLANKGLANGYAGLDATGKVPSAQLPSFVDDVLEYANLSGFPWTGETGKIYVALDTNKTYRWSWSAYVEISPSPWSTDSVTEGSTNLYFTTARVLGTLLTGLSTVTNAVITASDSVLSALGKLQNQITNLDTSKENSITLGTTAQYWRGDKSWQTLNKTAVGLANVDNTSDANKPVSTATQTALNLKANLISPAFTTPDLGTPSAGNLSNCTADGTNKVGYLNIPQNSQSTAYTLVLSDAGKHIYHPSADTTARTFTIPANSSVAFPIGTPITFVNDTSAGTITIEITTDTLVLAGAGTTGSRTLTANGVATAIKVTSTRWIISGTNLT